ncbi:MAG: hypothetical protein JWM27_2607 [Gemmatimonadetes bacterium]|nr:hypothetical protein [Gemmatimonadota bacterium]
MSIVETSQWTEWHLTPAGWVRGSSVTEFGRQSRSVPGDRVKTCVLQMSSAQDEPAVRLHDKVTFDPHRARELEDQFGPCPREL